MNRIEEAREYIEQRIINPALAYPQPDETTKHKVRNASRWLSHFDRVGDLLIYLKRFEGGTEADIYKQLKGYGLETFEDIVPDFVDRFGSWADDKTRFNDFVLGGKYNSYQILIFVGSYDTRSGACLLLAMGRNMMRLLLRPR